MEKLEITGNMARNMKVKPGVKGPASIGAPALTQTWAWVILRAVASGLAGANRNIRCQSTRSNNDTLLWQMEESA